MPLLLLFFSSRSPGRVFEMETARVRNGPRSTSRVVAFPEKLVHDAMQRTKMESNESRCMRKSVCCGSLKEKEPYPNRRPRAPGQGLRHLHGA